jgi:chromosomal replication initiator protein
MISPYVFPGLEPKEVHKMGLRKKRNDEISERIIRHICYDRNFDRPAFLSKIKTREIAIARQIAIYIIRQKTDMSLKEIGVLFKRDHSTIIYAIDTIKDLSSWDKVLRAEISHLMELF